MPFKIRMFNVDHGDSNIIEVADDAQKEYYLIDCSTLTKNKTTTCPAHDYLKKNNIKEITALFITHFHDDHFKGVEKILNDPDITIKSLIIPPVFSISGGQHEKRLKVMLTKALESSCLSKDEEHISKLKSYAHLIKYIKINVSKVMEVNGPNNVFQLSAIKNCSFKIYLPLLNTKGAIFSKIDKGNFDITHFPEMNDASLAISFEYKDEKMLFAGDSTRTQWIAHQQQFSRNSSASQKLNQNNLKISHHGSKHNNDSLVLNHIFKQPISNGFGFVSANGHSHPDPVVLKLLDSMDIKPRCSNMSPKCAPHMMGIIDLSSLSVEAANFIQNYQVVTTPTLCQGDMELEFNGTSYNYTSQTNIPCIYG